MFEQQLKNFLMSLFSCTVQSGPATILSQVDFNPRMVEEEKEHLRVAQVGRRLHRCSSVIISCVRVKTRVVSEQLDNLCVPSADRVVQSRPPGIVGGFHVEIRMIEKEGNHLLVTLVHRLVQGGLLLGVDCVGIK